MAYLKNIILLVLFLIPLQTFCQQNLNEAFYENCTLISYKKDGKDFFSSGFTIFNPSAVDSKRGNIFLITTRHSIPPRGQFGVIKLRFYRKNYEDSKERMELSVVLTDKNGYYLPTVRLNKNGEDLVAIDVTNDFVQNQVQANALPLDLLISKQDLKSKGFTIGDEIYTVGYPDGIFDEKNYSPIFRYGIISTLPYENYNFNLEIQHKLSLKPTLNGFIIDANVYPGSSGSLVIYKTLNNSLSVASFGGPKATPYILGIITGSIPFIDSNSNNIQRMGLGIVCSSEAIKETILFGIRLAEDNE